VVKNKPPLTDDDLLAEAFADVKPLAGKSVPKRQPQHIEVEDLTLVPKTPSQHQKELEAKAEFYRSLQSMKQPAPSQEMVVHDHSAQRLAGARPGVDLRKLQRGQLMPEAAIDLHGRSVQQAWVDMGQFLQRAQARGLRCVLVVHGKGNTTPTGMGGIKQNIGTWLGLTPFVLGYHSARPEHGGDGALYVLLKKLERT
jgi:DNA-nicking Smr family endonuclease